MKDNAKLFVEAIKNKYDEIYDKRRFFYHLGYYSRQGDWITTDQLKEVSRDFYFNVLVPDEKEIIKIQSRPHHRPCAYSEGFDKLNIFSE